MSEQKFVILRTELKDAEAVRACNLRAFGTDSFRERIFPPSKRHLTPKDEFTKWSADSLRKSIASGDMIHFKAVPEDDHSKVVGYSAWYRPGHFAGGKGVGDQLMGQKNAEEKTQPHSDLTAQAGTEGAKPPQPIKEADPEKKPDMPACMDIEAFNYLTKTMDQERRKIWGDDANFWYLGGLAVDTDYQRRGLARQLIDLGLEWADADGVPTYLESTPMAAAVYPKFGFQKVGSYPFFDGEHTSEFHIRQPNATTPTKMGFPRP